MTNWQHIHGMLSYEIKRKIGYMPRTMIDHDDVCPYCMKVPPVFFQKSGDTIGLIRGETFLRGWYYCPHCEALNLGNYKVRTLREARESGD